MRNAVPMRWIGQAEARQVLTAAQFEQAPTPPSRGTAGAATAQFLPKLRAWLAERYVTGWPALQMQPALVRRPAGRSERRHDGDDGYSCTW